MRLGRVLVCSEIDTNRFHRNLQSAKFHCREHTHHWPFGGMEIASGAFCGRMFILPKSAELTRRNVWRRLVTGDVQVADVFSVAPKYGKSAKDDVSEVDWCDCRRGCDDEDYFLQENHAEGNHVHGDHDDYCSASGCLRMNGPVLPFSSSA